MLRTITGRRLCAADRTIDYPHIAIDDDGIILSVEAGSPSADDTTLTSTFLDIHIHGAMGHDVMQDSAAGFAAMERFLATKGVGHFLATTVTAPVDDTLRALERIAAHIENSALKASNVATPVGIHLEGPFISHAKRGVHPAENILAPDIALFERFQQAAQGNIRLITIAPETAGALELIAHVTASGVRVSVGHSNALAAETVAAIAAGASSATHTFNAMRAIDHREPGIAGVVLTEPSLYAEIICDGIHVAPAMVELLLRCKGLDRAILVTDAMSAAGMPDGSYMLGDFAVQVAGGKATAAGMLAGSVLTLDQAVANFAQFTSMPVAEITHAASHNPARMLGIEELFSLTPGRPANLNRYAADGQLVATMLNGRQVG